MITSWILKVIEPRLHVSITYADLALVVWENKELLVPNVLKIHQLMGEIALCKQGNLEVVDFLNKLMGL